MLESDARQKLCFVAIGREYLGRPGTVFCVGSGCMGWQASIKPRVRKKDAAGKGLYIDHRAQWEPDTPSDPPEGFCAALPPELECGGGG